MLISMFLAILLLLLLLILLLLWELLLLVLLLLLLLVSLLLLICLLLLILLLGGRLTRLGMIWLTWMRTSSITLLLTSSCSPSHLLVVSLMLSKNFFAHFFFPFVNIRIKLISILFYREFLIIINWNKYFLLAIRFFFWIVELSDIGMLKCLLCCQSFIRVELKKIFKEVKCFFRCCWKHIS